ncbi:c-type cytochrome [Tenuibacillus multivorans]|uniref:Cytochrome C oxidase, cbb3-type, subunit III n=1 Tax=Tenuibacillus multivorans TaxID=237069 RepID=A0A1H0DKS6_9BACI|nr:cytochrome c [Tenuibacillus multivorans]GEL76516.1 hypothetical protein TMU01_07510 [Tenuibacillus multivorans]SDN70601.1 Cytochrome C oxidase, cbb3-type, subunit III [Tenuibacillus multivorans]
MRKLLVGVFSAMLVLAACGGGDDTEDNGGDNGDTNGEAGQEQDNGQDNGNSGDQGGDQGGDDQAGGDDAQNGATAQAGEELFQTNCASCHGGDLSGRMGPSLKNIGDDYAVEDIVSIIQNGKGDMPAVNGVDDEQANQIAEWLVNQ